MLILRALKTGMLQNNATQNKLPICQNGNIPDKNSKTNQ